MQHLPILPILLPMLAAVLMLLPPLSNSITRHRTFAVLIMISTVIVSALLLLTSHQQGTQMYVLGGWQPPFGIVLVADRLSTIMVLLTTLLGLGSQLYACAGDDNDGMYFHPLFMFLIMGVNGAFLTGDIFNLFVFFEVLLIASYALLIHGGGKQKTKANVHYVILNLVGSSIFLFALGILYGILGTLNIEDMANKVRLLDVHEQSLAKTGGLLLLVVFGLKAALLPLHFWLPRTYAAASAPVAALFAIMTKVGIYSILRVHTTIFGEDAGALASIAAPWLWPLAILTLIIGAIGVLASPSLRMTTANLVIVSVGTLMLAIAMEREAATSAALYYLIHSTFITGALFLIADLISKQRGKAEDRYVTARKLNNGRIIGIAFFIAALTVVGMPPLSGFVGKVLILQSAEGVAEIAWVWPVVLIAGLASLVAMSRAGTTLFWRSSGENTNSSPPPRLKLLAIALLLSLSPLLTVFGGVLTDYTNQAAAQLHDRSQPVYSALTKGDQQ
ncbi:MULTISPECIES: monovalent cation/H+ antiporter subunit D [unclassified Neptuniibacter]|uniref:monovalent cation/H+ antiporter subunit D n=1 Tax=unclassified Neptuniibacter TaxID=2630693 RepID=UPI000C415F80|nr:MULTISPECIES: monovalent cation/H+ antiporter subunit D [unclassified Neptuniibacter]MAY42460.1 monovalent cation/H+ antiporter subunit D [Oceanospirillaceae bacterium]|tara:strand:- start:4779 stop:6290 length:1512 start_codon:yes stop_codon:yes gene_type:complete